ncbi:MAG: hypothetical protein HC833_17680 [Leptolyngbyaceae cyanobacterium RM1_406_9]|nr:hypothetical protein [Leptolyngbyaceae cyanobacterium RM1_406_9]
MKGLRVQIQQLSRLDWHYVGLAAVLLLGTVLRFWQLDAKPLWLDEVITAIFSLGHSQADLPLGVAFSVSQLKQIFTLNSGVSCAQIAQTVSTESVHPPLFFCLLYRWISWLNPNSENWIWALRSLSASMGVGAIASVYWLNRVAFSASAGLMAAAVMAVSPFAVYLSQEARQYTLPMLLILLALTGLVQMQQDLHPVRRLRPAVWLGWVAINSLGLYIHYFFALVLVAQIMALGGWMLWQRSSLRRWAAVGMAIAGIILSYLPWLTILLGHFSRPETTWLSSQEANWESRIAPIYQTIAGWVVMVITLPVEDQPEQIVIPSAALMLIFVVWLVWQVRRGFKRAWSQVEIRPSLLLLAGFTLSVLVQFFAIVYILNKDITVVPRYNFVYYPGVCALLGVALVHLPFRIGLPVLLVGILSSALVVNDLAFHKAYYPSRIARDMYVEPETPLVLATSYTSIQEIALGLSFGLELSEYFPDRPNESLGFALIDRTDGFDQAWSQLSRVAPDFPLPFNLWVIAAPGMRTNDYPLRLQMTHVGDGDRPSKISCTVDPEEFGRIGFPYQFYRCR